MLLEIEKQEKIQRINRDLNSKKNVTTHFETFKENITKYYEMIESIKTLCENQYSQEFISGLFEARYNAIEKFANIVINENISVVFQYLDEHYNSIKNELEKIKKINEIIDIENAPTYFVTHEIYSDEPYEHLIDLATDEDVIAPLLFLRQREIVHFDRFQELYKKYKSLGY
jgi:hypothetical protein